MPNPTISKNSDITNQYIDDLLSYVDKDVSTSRECLRAGIDTKTSAYLRTLITDPINAFLEINSKSRGDILKSVFNIMDVYFKKNKQYISKAYYNELNKTTFYLILKDDNFKIRENFLEFLGIFDELNISKHFTISINFLPEGSEGYFDEKSEISLD